MDLENINEAWDNFIEHKSFSFEKEEEITDYSTSTFEENIEKNVNEKTKGDKIPKCSELYISTKTKIVHLNQSIDLSELFWKINVIPYYTTEEGVVKKQMKINSTSREQLENIQEKLKQVDRHYTEQIISHIENPDGRIKFKDIRKINIGLSRKDIESYRARLKGAFYNCFVLILRVKQGVSFKELHVKIFNTGKMEIPGIQKNETLFKTLDLVIKNLKPFIKEEISYKKDSVLTALYNSNFKCGYFINRDKLFHLLKYKFNIQAMFDPCSYPGVQSKFYYKKGVDDIKGFTGSKTEDTDGNLSFMIFRTGSVLIVGKCEKRILIHVYGFIKNILETTYEQIKQEKTDGFESNQKITASKRKIRKKIIMY